MIILAFSVAAMLVTGSFIGRRLAQAREEWSIEFRASEFELTGRSSIPAERPGLTVA
jgi:hypothetical protein